MTCKIEKVCLHGSENSNNVFSVETGILPVSTRDLAQVM